MKIERKNSKRKTQTCMVVHYKKINNQT